MGERQTFKIELKCDNEWYPWNSSKEENMGGYVNMLIT
jgi:hypothetical protein